MNMAENLHVQEKGIENKTLSEPSISMREQLMECMASRMLAINNLLHTSERHNWCRVLPLLCGLRGEIMRNYVEG